MIDFINNLDRVEDKDLDKLIRSVLGEIHQKFELMLMQVKSEYNIKLSPAQAFALRLFYINFFHLSVQTHVGNKLLQLCNDIHKYYS